jgi:hypothetical protein
MTPSFVPERFERVMGCTGQELVAQLPGALPNAALTFDKDGLSCTAVDSEGLLRLDWKPLEPTRLGLLVIPRLSVCFQYGGLTDDRRYAMQKRFDLGTHRGGG